MRRASVFVALWLHAAAYAAGVVQVSGTSVFADAGDNTTITFTCLGSPTCTGSYTQFSILPECNAPISYTGVFSITGLNLSAPGTFSGTIFFDGGDLNAHSVNGVCSATFSPITASYNAGWDGHNGSITLTTPDGSLTASFTANASTAPPVFPISINAGSSITPTVANVSVSIQPRPQDVGQNAGIFVFAHAPRSKVNGAKLAPAQTRPALTLDDPDPCVLAQVDANGNLNAVSASTMQAAINGTLTSQGQSLAVLNNVATPNVAGATMFVGYGSTASTMLTNGIYEGAVTVPGAATCRSSLASAAAATSPGALTGLWWNANESGWGLHLTQRGSNVFAAWYTYDTAGKPKWYVATCAGAGATSGTCTGTLYQVTGPNFFGGGFNPGQVNATNAGTLSVTFSNANAASMTYTVGSQTRTVSLTRQPLATGTTPPAIDYSDIWWNASESGWGMAMAQQYGITFLAWYVYDATGKPTWLVSTCTMAGSSCRGTLYRTVGPPFGPSFNPSSVTATAAGTATVVFIDANNATIDYTVDGVTARKTVTRQLF